jgi:hypothetical protein
VSEFLVFTGMFRRDDRVFRSVHCAQLAVGRTNASGARRIARIAGLGCTRQASGCLAIGSARAALLESTRRRPALSR